METTNEYENWNRKKGSRERIKADCEILMNAIKGAKRDYMTNEVDCFVCFKWQLISDYGDITQIIKYIKATGEVMLYTVFPIPVPEDKTADMCILLNTINRETSYSRCYIDENRMIQCQCGIPGTEFRQFVFLLYVSLDCGYHVYADNYKAITSIIFSK
jgi:hypothetical protein